MITGKIPSGNISAVQCGQDQLEYNPAFDRVLMSVGVSPTHLG